LSSDQIGILIGVPHRAVPLDGLGKTVLVDALQLFLHRLSDECRDGGLSAAPDEPLHAVKLRLFGVDDCLLLGRFHAWVY
jgi:hypothetical protein